MDSSDRRCRGLQLGTLLLTFTALAGCVPPRPPPVAAPSPGAQEVQADHPDPAFWIMLGEMAANRGALVTAAEAYLKAAQLSASAQVAQRAAELATASGDQALALKALQRWSDLAPSEQDAAQALALLHLRLGNVDEAKQAFIGLLRPSDGESEADWRLVRELLRQSRAEPAKVLAIAEALRDEWPESAQAHYTVARVALDAGQAEQALAALDKAEALGASRTTVAALKAQALLGAGKAEEALALLDRAIEREPDDVGLRIAHGRLLMELERYQPAREAFEQARRLSPDRPEVLYHLALLAMRADNREVARKHLLHLVRTGSRQYDAYYHLGVLELKEGNYESALQWFVQVQGGHYLLPAQVQIADVLARLGEVDAARSHLQELRQRNPGLSLPLFLAEGELLHQYRRFEAAYDLFSEALSQYEDERRLLYGRALAAEQLGRLEQAERDLRRILAESPDDANALNALGYMLTIRTQRYREAKDLIERALALEPDNAAIIDSMGWVHYKLGNFEEAEAYLERAYELQADPEIAAHLGELYWTIGRRQKAREVWEAGLDAFPGSEVLTEVVDRYLR